MHKLKAGLVGLVTIFLTLVGMTASLANALSLIVISVVCTAGISLIIWVPLCIGVGWLLLRLADELRRLLGNSPRGPSLRSSETHGTTPPVPSLVQTTAIADQTALEHYIHLALRLDHDRDRIYTTLHHQGWTTEEIDRAYQSAIQT